MVPAGVRRAARTILVGICLIAFPSISIAAEPDRLVNEDAVGGFAISQAVAASLKTGKAPWDQAGAGAVEQFYEQRANQPLWVTINGYSPRAREVIAELGRAGDWGLVASDYSVGDPGNKNLTQSKLVDAELTLTMAVIRYAHDAHVGRFDPRRISELIDLMSIPPSPAEVLSGLAQSPDPARFLASFNPQHREFLLLREKYLALIEGREAKATPAQIPDGPLLKPGDTSPDIALFRQRLRTTPSVGSSADTYDQALVEAVQKFQLGIGLKADGTITPALRRALNGQARASSTTIGQVEQIRANMERWRWVPEQLGENYILDNIPEFLTRIVENGQVVHTARIVVGKPSTPTPIFSNSIKYVEFHPFWRVPDSIKFKEILPSIAHGGSGALTRRGLRIEMGGKEINPARIRWTTTNIKTLDVFQPPGPGNALGDVKFMFPNHFDVYMHDTPSKELFADNVRAFSHGCIRVQNPQAFAEFVMGLGNGWMAERVQQEFATNGNEQVQLDNPLPVHVTYFTVRINDNGDLSYFDDVYGQDQRTALAIAGKWNEVRRQLAPKVTEDEALFAEAGLAKRAHNTSLWAYGGGGTSIRLGALARTPTFAADIPANQYLSGHH
jgi:L,D-transpeptidase YcbB